MAQEDRQGVKERPGLVMFSKTIRGATPWGTLFVSMTFDGKEPFDVFASLGKAGNEVKAMTEGFGRVISIALRSGCRIEDLINTLSGVAGSEVWTFDHDPDTEIRSLPDALAHLMATLVEYELPAEGKLGDAELNVGDEEVEQPTATGEARSSPGGGVPCPQCSAPMVMTQGCAVCLRCGYSPCK